MLVPDDADHPGGQAVVVLSHEAWETAFGSDPHIVGRVVTINTIPLRVVGVARDGFRGLESSPIHFWAPVTMSDVLNPSTALFAPSNPGEALRIVGRLAPGARVDAVRTAIHAWLSQVLIDAPPTGQAMQVTLQSRRSPIPLTPPVIEAFTPLAVAFLLVLLIACANVANVMLARGMARQREIGVRLALGAARGRLIRQLLTESVLLSVPASMFGYVVSRAGIALSVYVTYTQTPPSYRSYFRVMPLSPDMRVVIFTMLAGVGAAIMFGLAPALQATRPSVVRATRGDFESSLRPSKLRNALVVTQIAASVLLLICAGILLRAARDTKAHAPGIRTENVVQVQLLDRGRQRGIETLRTMPGVLTLASAATAPLDGLFREFSSGGVTTLDATTVRFNIVSPEYFRALDLRTLRGRIFDDDEARGRAAVAVVSEQAARMLWPGTDPIGQRLTTSPAFLEHAGLTGYRDATVIGVTSNAVPGWIGMPAAMPIVYFPQPIDASGAVLVARTAIDGERARADIEHMLMANDSLAVGDIHSLEAARAVEAFPYEISYWIASLVGGVALLLTAIGVYGVLSYLVAQRTRELGIRAALGASPSGLIGLALSQLSRLAALSFVLGIALALIVSRLFATVLPLDTYAPIGYVIGSCVVLVTCFVAAYIPARRAAFVNPVEALRADS